MLAIVALAAALALLWTLIDARPLVLESARLGVDEAAHGREVLKRTRRLLLGSSGDVSLRFTEDELNSIVAMVSRAVPTLRGRVNVAPAGLEAALSYRLPAAFHDGYVNARAGLDPSSEGFAVNRFEIGGLRIPGWLGVATLRAAANVLLADERGDVLFSSVRATSFEGRSVVIHLSLPPEFHQALRDGAARLADVRDEVTPIADPDDVRRYYAALLNAADALGRARQNSLAEFLQPVFALAAARSEAGDAVEENTAALLALAIHFGDTRFEKFVGPVRAGLAGRRAPRRGKANLRGRNDLVRHFVVSAGLKILTDSGVSFAIGEIKELLDTSGGGSGFSFADIAADRAGIRFATLATRPGDAGRLQQTLAGTASEGSFFPSIAGLPEGLSQRELELRYGGVEGARYAALIAAIDARLDALALYDGRTP